MFVFHIYIQIHDKDEHGKETLRYRKQTYIMNMNSIVFFGIAKNKKSSNLRNEDEELLPNLFTIKVSDTPLVKDTVSKSFFMNLALHQQPVEKIIGTDNAMTKQPSFSLPMCLACNRNKSIEGLA